MTRINCEGCGELAVIIVPSVLLSDLQGRDGAGRHWICKDCMRVCEFCQQARYWEETHTPQNAHGPWCDLCRLKDSAEHVLFRELPYVNAEISKWESQLN